MQNIIEYLYNNQYLFLIITLFLGAYPLFYLFNKKLKFESFSPTKFLSIVLFFIIIIMMVNSVTLITIETKNISVKKVEMGQSYTIYDENNNKYVLETSKRIEKGDELNIRKDYVGNWHLN